MKKYTVIILLIFSTTLTFAQKKDKIKGSKKVTTELREVGNFETIIVEDNIEVYLEKGETTGIKVEADSNLHEFISMELKDKTLRFFTTIEPIKFKKLVVKITYTSDLKSVSSRNDAIVNAIQEVQIDSIAFKSIDNSKLFLNINTKNFVLEAIDKSQVELNAKSEKIKISLSGNAELKALINGPEMICDLYQKAQANIEGAVPTAVIRLDNNSSFKGNKLTIKDLELVTESASSAIVNAETSISISAKSKSQVQLYGNAKIEMKKFTEEAKLFKKDK
ncbi:GIN domain-containing protein [Flavobacterium hiemivividum]|uniref:DUF2807 domain-containing protein n=1 Tax=Flavobacterium hiemivividum TaxID=2541734 RepID=A0A4V2Z1F4_9FLAO|nr:DUF2807 domain-containing protein [Flavobacterium hiemivividum]TDE04678.1 DUF2807 domain-containing protein [Flavobacterium hiemivividum]